MFQDIDGVLGAHSGDVGRDAFLYRQFSERDLSIFRPTFFDHIVGFHPSGFRPDVELVQYVGQRSGITVLDFRQT